MRRSVPTAAAVLLSTTLALAGCGSGTESAAPGSDASPTATLVNCDTEVAITAPIDSAVAINQPAVELLLALDLGDRIDAVGYSDVSVLPELAPGLTGVHRFDAEFPSFEAVLDREPDLVYATFDYTFTDEGIAERDRFDDLGIVTYQSPSECGGQDAEQDAELTIEDLYAEIGDVAALFGVPERGAELIDTLSARAQTAAGTVDASDVTLAWWYAGTTTPYIAGCCGAPGIMTRAIGAQNAFADQRQYWPEIGWESILDRDPTVLVLADLGRGGDGDSAEDKIAFLESDPVASKLTAVKNRNYIVLGGTTMDPSIRNIAGIEQLAAGIDELGVGR